MHPLKIKRGERYGMLRIVREVPEIDGYRMFETKCDCGNSYVARLNNLRRKTDPVRSCGCRKREVLGESRRTHGMSQTPTYRIWCGMKNRCENPNDKRSYPNYGGRGIKVCERWQRFENFLADMGERPSTQHEIDRIDGNGNYEPGNARWLDDGGAQSRNRRKLSGSSKYRGVDHWKNQAWRARISIKGKIRDLGLHDSEEAAARAYDAVARRHKGYRLNFPGGT